MNGEVASPEGDTSRDRYVESLSTWSPRGRGDNRDGDNKTILVWQIGQEVVEQDEDEDNCYLDPKLAVIWYSGAMEALKNASPQAFEEYMQGLRHRGVDPEERQERIDELSSGEMCESCAAELWLYLQDAMSELLRLYTSKMKVLKDTWQEGWSTNLMCRRP